MEKIRVNQVDAFTTELFGGNPAAVVLDGSGLDESTMRKIAREMNLSETAFILPSEKGDFRLRYFTPPGDEIKFCGHATIGALHEISVEKMFGISSPKEYLFKVETDVGVLDMKVDYKGESDIKIKFSSPKIDLIESKYSHKEIADALGIELDKLDQTRPVMLEKTNNYLYLTVKSLKDLESLKVDFASAKKFAKKDEVIVYCLMVGETLNEENNIHTRGFAPLVGVNEDPVTGSMQGGLAAYAHMNGLLKERDSKVTDDDWEVRVEQGHFIGRPGYLTTILKYKEDYEAEINASAVHVFSTEINLTS